MSEIRGVNYYGTSAATPEEAIKEAVENGFKYKSPEEMNQRLSFAERLQNQAANAISGRGDIAR